MLRLDLTSSPVSSGTKPAVAGGTCQTCTYWLESHGCCRSDCERFRSMIPVGNCQAWKPLAAQTPLPQVCFGGVAWADAVRRSA